MRASRIRAALAGVSARPRKRLRICCALMMAGLVSPAQAAPPEPTPTVPPPADRVACFGILGEVARPGVYQLPSACTFGELVRQAGGVTRNANGNARVFRGARLAQQLFVAASDAQLLRPSDMIVLERGGTAQSTIEPMAKASAQSPGRSREPSAVQSDVQIGIINLIDRPVVLKLPAEQASLARIVESLRQPPDLIDSIRVVGPAPDVRATANAGSLRSGTVLIFPSHVGSRVAGVESLRFASSERTPGGSLRSTLATPSVSLPLLPDLITASPHAPFGEPSPTDTHRAEISSVTVVAPTAPRSSTYFRLASAPRLTEKDLSQRRTDSRNAAARVPPFRNVSPEVAERWRREEEDRAEGRAYFSFAVLGGIAVWAILVTVGSMGRRGVERWRAGAASRLQASLALAPTPEFSLGKRPHRPLRIDVNQPQTRLALDLAIFERALARHAAATLDNPPSRAA
jgi:hypothetical protein